MTLHALRRGPYQRVLLKAVSGPASGFLPAKMLFIDRAISENLQSHVSQAHMLVTWVNLALRTNSASAHKSCRGERGQARRHLKLSLVLKLESSTPAGLLHAV